MADRLASGDGPAAVRLRAAASVPRWVRLWSVVLAVAGLVVSAYLTVEHYTASSTLACPDTGVINCQKVTSSDQSQFLGLPVALLGLLFFVAMVVLTLPVAWRLPARWPHRARLAASALGVAFVIYLIYVELFVLDAICLWCTAVHVLTLALFAVIAFGAASAAPADD